MNSFWRIRDMRRNECENRERPEAHLSSIHLIDTGMFSPDDVDLVGFESALACCPLSFQGDEDVRGIGGPNSALCFMKRTLLSHPKSGVFLLSDLNIHFRLRFQL